MPALRQEKTATQERKEEEVSPAEDLMREHGLLNRVLLIYEETGRRLQRRVEYDPGPLAGAAKIIQQFIEGYHEKLEEEYLFPRFEKAGRLTELVRVLREQHQAGRRLTGQIQKLAGSTALQDAAERQRLDQALHAFVRMYRPHEAREDTVLFPALREIVSSSEYDALGEKFEKKERQLFGSEGFEKMVDQVADLEKRLGIYDLSKFTPR
jgi:hemerythrin-like domain-containing protein